MIESIDWMSSPLDATSSVIKTPTFGLTSTPVSVEITPENSNPDAPFPDLPFVVI